MMVFLLPDSDLPVSLKASEPGIGIKKPNASGRGGTCGEAASSKVARVDGLLKQHPRKFSGTLSGLQSQERTTS